MTDDELSRMFRLEGEIVPSAGFVASVMEAVKRDALAPPTIQFPWKRALPGLATAGLTLAWFLVVAVTHFGSGMKIPLPAAALPSALTTILEAVALSVLVLVLSLASLMLSIRLASRRT